MRALPPRRRLVRALRELRGPRGLRALVAALCLVAAASAQDPVTLPMPAADDPAPLPTLDRDGVVDRTADDVVRVRWELPERPPRPGEVAAVALVVDVDADFLGDHLVQPFTRRMDLPIAIDAPGVGGSLVDPFGVPDDDGGGDRLALGGHVVRADESFDAREDGRAWRRARILAGVRVELPGALELAAPVVRFVSAETFREELLGRTPVDARIAFARGAPARVEVADFPEAGRSPDFDGLVGAFDLDVVATPTELRVGDLVRVVVDVHGPVPEDVDRLPRFDRLRGLHLVSRSVEALVEGARLTLEYRVERASVDEVPALELHSFVPADGLYAVARSRAVPLRVTAAPEEPAAAEEDGSSPAVWIAGAVAGALAAFALSRRRASRAGG